MDTGLIAAASGLVGSLVTGGFGVIMWRLQVKKFDAEVLKIRAEAERIEAEVDDLTSARLIRELDRLSAANDSAERVIGGLRTEIDALRRQVIEYAAREMNHAAENEALRRRVAELEGLGSKSPLTQALVSVHPVHIPHTENEFDDDGATGKAE
jgi:hypothetical protein